MFHMSSVKIAEFIWLTGQKRVNVRKNVQNLLRNHKLDGADAFHAC